MDIYIDVLVLVCHLGPAQLNLQLISAESGESSAGNSVKGVGARGQHQQKSGGP